MESEILSDDELAEITGYKARAYQRRWLDDRKWLYVESRGKRPLVGRQYARMKLGIVPTSMPDPNPPPARPAWTPDYANSAVWHAVYSMAEPELKEAMDLGYLTGQRPADVILMRSDDREGDYFMVIQGKNKQKLRILPRSEDGENSLGKLIREITDRNAHHPSKYLLISKHGKRMTKGMLRLRWDKAREKAQQKAIEEGRPPLAAKIAGFQFRDIRPKAASEIVDIADASLLLGHTQQEITKRVYRRVGVTAKPSK